MTDVLKQLSPTCDVNHLWNDLCFIQWSLRRWCWEEWHTSLKTPVNMCLRWVQCKHRYTHAVDSCSLFQFLFHLSLHLFTLSIHLVFCFLCSITSAFPFSSSCILSTPPSRPAGQMVLCHLLSELSRRWQSCCPRSGPPLKHTFPDW